MKQNYLEIKHVPYENLTMGEESTFYHDMTLVYSHFEIVARIIGTYCELTF